MSRAVTPVWGVVRSCPDSVVWGVLPYSPPGGGEGPLRREGPVADWTFGTPTSSVPPPGGGKDDYAHATGPQLWPR